MKKKEKKYLKKFKDYENLIVLLIGSSITSQEWCHPNWHDWMEYTFRQDENWDKAWKRKIINTARDGASISHYLNNFDTEILRFKPDLVIESLGVNSIIPDLDEAKTQKEIYELNKRILGEGFELATWSYQLGSATYDERMKRLRDIHKELALELNYQFVDIYEEFKKYDLSKIFMFIHPWQNKPWGMKPGDVDFLHCNEVGNQIIAEKLLKELFDKEINRDEFGTMKLLDLTKYIIH